MKSTRVLATLAGTSLLLPTGLASASIIVPKAPPAPRTGNQPLKIADASVTIQPGEAFASRADVIADEKNYHLILTVPTTTGGTAYTGTVVVTGFGQGALPADLNRPVGGLFTSNKENFVDKTAVGATTANGSCLVKLDTTNINWVPATTNVLATVRLDKAGFDAALKKTTGPITVTVKLETVAKCPALTTKEDENK